MKFPALLLTVLLIGAAHPAATAAIVVVAPTGFTAGSVTITQDITFTLTTGVTAGSDLYFSLDEWVTSDGSGTFSVCSPPLSISINGGLAQTYGSSALRDNYASLTGSLTANDGYFYIIGSGSVPVLSVGNTVTVKAASYTLSAISGFNPQATQTFTGNMYMFNSAGTPISNVVQVPEPGSAALLVGGVALLGCRRRRR